MSHRVHHGWERFTSSSMTTVSMTCWCGKCTHIAVLVATRTGHPSTWQLYGPTLAGKAIRYVQVSSPVAKVFKLHCASVAYPC